MAPPWPKPGATAADGLLGRRVAVCGAAASVVLIARRSSAQAGPALYQATTIVTGTDMRQRPIGFSRCLVEVLVKLTGAPDLGRDPSVAALAEHADEFVASFSYTDPRAALLHHDDQGTYDRSYELTVRFDPDKVGAALARLGLTIWHGPRPLLNPVILVRDRNPTPFLLSAEVPRGAEMRQAIIRSAGELGIGVHFPTDSDLAEQAVGLTGFPAPLGGAAAGHMQVAGALSWSVRAMGWVAVWRAVVNDVEHEWGIGGVGYDEALTNLVRGAVMLAAGTGIPPPGR